MFGQYSSFVTIMGWSQYKFCQELSVHSFVYCHILNLVTIEVVLQSEFCHSMNLITI